MKYYVSADEIAGFDFCIGVGDGDSVIGEYGSWNFECFSGDGGILGVYLIYVDDGDWPFERFGCVEGVILFEDIHKGVLPFAYIIHLIALNIKFKL